MLHTQPGCFDILVCQWYEPLETFQSLLVLKDVPQLPAMAMPVLQRGVEKVYNPLPVSLPLGDHVGVQAGRMPAHQSYHRVVCVIEKV